MKADLRLFRIPQREWGYYLTVGKAKNKLHNMRFLFTFGWLLQLTQAIHLLQFIHVPLWVWALLSLSFRTFLNCCHYQLRFVALLLDVQNSVHKFCTYALRDRKIEHVFVPVAIQLQKNPTTLRRTLQVSQRAIMAVRGGDHTTLSQTARQSQRVTQNQGASQQSPNHSSQLQKSKASQLERRSDWQMWRR